LRREIEAQGGLKLIYIDPPFDVGADFSMDIEIGGDTFTKKPNILEEIAYRDTWGKGADSFIVMIYERLALMRDLLAEDGSIYVHCDWRVNSYVRLVLDEVFGKNNFLNQVIWKYHSGSGSRGEYFSRKHDDVLFYAKNKGQHTFVDKKVRQPYDKKTLQRHLSGYKGHEKNPGWRPNPSGKLLPDVWEINGVSPTSPEREGYPTQKPKELIKRIIKASSNEGDLIADFFCGSGTIAAVAEKLGRKWIAGDLGKFAIHTTRKRMIGVQRKLKKDDKPYRAFEILNLGKYERQHYIGVNPGLRPEQQQQQIAAKSREYQTLILNAYAAEPLEHSGVFHGKKAGRMVAIGPINLPVTRHHPRRHPRLRV